MCGNGSSFGWKNGEETEESLPTLVIDEDLKSDIEKYNNGYEVIDDDGELVDLPPLTPCSPKPIGQLPFSEPKVVAAVTKRAPFAPLFDKLAAQTPEFVDNLSSECSRHRFQMFMRHDRWRYCSEGVVDPLTGKIVSENEVEEVERMFGPILPKTTELEVCEDLPGEPTTQPPTPPATPPPTPAEEEVALKDQMSPIAKMLLCTAYGKTAERINEPRCVTYSIKKTRSGRRY